MNNFISKNRCIGLTKTNKKCRAIIKNNEIFCCKEHYPFNTDLIEDFCFICQEKVEKSNDILFLKCRHAFHKPCFIEWLQYSTYENPICLFCRSVVFKNQREEKKNKIIKNSTNIDHLIKISNLLK